MTGMWAERGMTYICLFLTARTGFVTATSFDARREPRLTSPDSRTGRKPPPVCSQYTVLAPELTLVAEIDVRTQQATEVPRRQSSLVEEGTQRY